jgi:hypothetical protein
VKEGLHLFVCITAYSEWTLPLLTLQHRMWMRSFSARSSLRNCSKIPSTVRLSVTSSMQHFVSRSSGPGGVAATAPTMQSLLMVAQASDAQWIDLTPQQYLKLHPNSVYTTMRISRGNAHDLCLHVSRLARCVL